MPEAHIINLSIYKGEWSRGGVVGGNWRREREFASWESGWVVGSDDK